MGDSEEDKKMGGVPSWQLKPSALSPEQKAIDPNSTKQQTSAHTSVIEKARRFLLEDEVRNAPTNKQIAFLESKGLESHEIQELLGVTRNVEATTSIPEASTTTEEPTIKPSTQTLSEPLPASPTQSSSDVPPIITYPEFLITPAQPAPLITARRLLGTLYLFGGLSALLYGTSHYLIKPMVASLTTARHELAENTQSNLDKLVTKLEAIVSEVPPSLSSSAATPYRDSALDEEEVDDSDSDPTELFHRDIGVQTSPSISRHTSPSPLPTSITTRSVLDAQTDRLSRMISHITDLNDASVSLGQETTQLTTCISILKEYLESLAYVPPTYTYGGSAGAMYGGSAAAHRSGDGTADDEIAKVKAQIRGVKGVLLSARSFPAGPWQGKGR